MADKNGQDLRKRNVGSSEKEPKEESDSSKDKEKKLYYVIWDSVLIPLKRLIQLAIVGLILYAILKESPIKAVAYTLQDPPTFVGPLAPNTKLQEGKRILEGKISGPESLAFYKGNIYTGTYNGEILRISTTDHKIRRLARLGVRPCGKPEYEPTCGRPLGIHIDNGHIYVLDAYLGLFEVEDGTGKHESLAHNKRTYDAKAVAFANDLAKFSRQDGDFFMTDSSRKWQRRQFPLALFEADNCGRLIWYNPKSSRSNVALPKLFFPNGITMSPQEDFLLIAESSRFRILKYYIDGPKSGNLEIFADNLPGIPDNITPSSTGGYWVGLAYVGGRMGSYPFFDFLADKPWLRNLITKFVNPAKLLSLLPTYGMIIELDQEGLIRRSLHDPTGEVVGSVSEVLDTGDALYLGSFSAPYLVKVDMRTNKM
ncbi:adipocyte plasma membrane-associated protein-like [Amphiura filiformis]|uniref:adipocyte plasma membrane-associated protein-like n=1 Tax=Amphiura filiformis TaxID=82378 RepID=UPI003B20C60F